MTPEEKAKERLARFQEAKRKAEEEKNLHSSFPKEEVPEFKVVVLNKDKPKILRLVGNSPLMRHEPSDPLIVKRSMCVTDDGNYATIILPEDRDNPINKLFRTIVGKYKYDKNTKTKTYENAEKPSFKRFMYNGKNKEDCSAMERGMQADTFYMFNCIDRSDNWCKENKHTKLLCWDSTSKEVNGKTRTYYTYGIKPSMYNNIFDIQCTNLNRMYDMFDVAVMRLSKKIGDNVWIKICNPEERSAITNMGLNSELVTMNYLTDEEEAYERYDLEDIPFVTRPTSCSFVLRAFPKLIKSCDLDNGTNLYEEFVEWAEKEKAEWSKQNAEKANSESKTEETATETEEVEVEETTATETTQSFDTMGTVETSSDDELPSEVEENPTPTVQKVAKVAKVAKFDPMSLVDKYPSITKMSEEERSHIVGYNSEKDEFEFDDNNLCECPECGKTIHDSFTRCFCNVEFE